MSNYQPEDWYQLLVDQSKTNRIYDLIHEGLSPHFRPRDINGIVVVNPLDLPAELTEIPLQHIAKAAFDFRENKLILLKNNFLAAYLEKATAMKVYQGLETEYVLLSFEPIINDEEDDAQTTGSCINTDNPESVFDEDDSLMHCWALVTKCQHKALALELAVKGHAYLDKKRLSCADANERVKISFGYNIVSVAYAWNNCFEDAAITDSYYIRITPFYAHMEGVIKPYLEMLIAKKQAAYLDYLFNMEKFKDHFLPHYEAYISLFVNPHYECMRMREMIPIINRVNNGLKRYL